MTEYPNNECASVEINRLHGEVVRASKESRDLLHGALTSAWRAGQLLMEAKRRVRRGMGAGAWQIWLEQYFASTPRTAQRYMLLAKNVSDVSAFHGLSLRQVYFRLGIATEPKSAAQNLVIPPVPHYIGLAGRLLKSLGQPARLSPDRLSTYRKDLRPLYEKLRSLFE
ncbi:hypothetical protein CMV30_03710 [Nibricoccus aquaticus]|uniref:DUF3102 domain-containing protein n=1 Tax=Nibricoccus aquaticus TaxID=2576891 RepID=A0A290QGX4_9BACT|nr:hypothetical protein [Nibricoccus aquaticus]ATC63132.1 hypothetical protein CMV30_03710 [Nibricoccus aquaticus]